MLKLLRLTLTVALLIGLQCTLFAQFPPENNSCINAQVIQEGDAIPFTTASATTDGPNHENDCRSLGTNPTQIFNDVWFQYTASFTGQAEFSTCSTADFDTKIAVYSPGSPCPPTDADLYACNEDGTACDNSTSRAIFDVTAGEVYLLRLGGYGTDDIGQSGEGTFRVGAYTPPPGPPNDNCVDAMEIDLGDDESIVIEFESLNANTDGPEHFLQSCFTEGETTVYNDIWWRWTSTFDGALEFSNCGTSNFDSRVAVYADDNCPPDPLTLVGCSDDGLNENNINCVGFTSRAIFTVRMGQTYLFRLGGWNASGAGVGSVLFQRTEPPMPPANDACANAIPVDIITQQAADDFDVIYQGTNQDATSENDANPTCRSNGEFIDVWYSFNSGNNTELGFRFNITTPGANYVIDLFDACGEQADSTSAIFCLNTENSGTEFILDTITNLAGVPTDYLLRVSTRITTEFPGEFWFQLVGDPSDGTSITELDLRKFNFFPNPVNKSATVSFELSAPTNMTAQVINTLGQVVQNQSFGRLMSGQQELQIATSTLSNGLYFLHLKTKEGQQTVRFLKE